MSTLDEFNKRIENDELEKPKIDLYLKSIEKLYCGIWTDPDILEHIELLKQKQPEAKFTDFDEYLKSENLSYSDLTENEDGGRTNWYKYYTGAFEDQPKTRHLTPNDLKIAKILKLRVQGASITISPKENTISWEDLLAKTKKIIDCDYIKDAQYFIEFYTDGCPTGNKPHIHMYAHLTDINLVNTVASYIRSKFKKTSCSIEKKHDITYGVKDYLEGKASLDAKKKFKKLDKIKRAKLNIPDVFNL